MIAVTTTTGLPMRIGEAVLDPTIPTLFEEIPPEVEFQRVNLRYTEVESPDDPSLSNAPYRTPEGETRRLTNGDAAVQPEVVSSEDHVAVVNERDRLKVDLATAQSNFERIASKEAQYDAVVGQRDEANTKLQAALVAKASAEGDLATVRAAKDAAESAVASLTTERDQLSTGLKGANDNVESLYGQLNAAGTRATEAEAARNQAVAQLQERDGKPSEREQSLSDAVEAVLSASATSLGRLTNDALAKLCAVKGISPIPDTTEALVAALKPA